jgi:ABC-2 type transport system ATP-binding protein
VPPQLIGDRIEYVLDLLQLQTYADQLTGTYSGGLKKRLDLAAGLLHQPSVLILDEPTVGLDIQSRTAIWEFLRKLKAAGVTVIISSHYLEEIDALADRVAIINRGKIIAEGTTNELKNKVGGDRITIRIREFAEREEAEHAKKILQQLPIVQSITINAAQGNSVNLFVTPDTNAISDIQNMLMAVDINIFSLSQSRPSLDDVFLEATGQTILDAEFAQSEILMAEKNKKKTPKKVK